MTSAVASGLFSLGSGLLGGIFDAIGANSQYKNQVKLQNLAYQQQKELISEQNEYNDPSAQMERARRAGLNPYFAIGGSYSGNQPSAGSVPSFPTSVPTGLSAFASRLSKEISYLDIAQRTANIEKTKAETDGIRKQTDVADYNLNNILPQQLKNLDADKQLKWTQANSIEFDTKLREQVSVFETESKRMGFIASYHKSVLDAWKHFAQTQVLGTGSEAKEDVFGERWNVPDNFNDFKHDPLLSSVYSQFKESEYLATHFAKWHKYDDMLISQVQANIQLLVSSSIRNAASTAQIRQSIELVNKQFNDLVSSVYWKNASEKERVEMLHATTNSIYHNITNTDARTRLTEQQTRTEEFKTTQQGINTFNPFNYIKF